MGAVAFVDTSVVVAILAKEPDWRECSRKVAAATERLTSPVVRLETSIVLAARLLVSPRQAEGQFERFLKEADVSEVGLDAAVGIAAVACFETFGKGRHPARLNFADCLTYACARLHGATLLFKGDDFSKTDINDQRS
ncbi:ribonuclease VapC [Roseiarcus fermentans]|uniref:Ribonuclease VapC n=1 Tax=Roseiarcus fermentans TaxID=1473586 RepID=A0A366FVA6_9HYPH|nr:type II toxin-antitoxin system VapC family toxin [Roseiarcus fermentans]RBP18086.1 ribonuclease VapC [Roseiarcus fermentans]